MDRTEISALLTLPIVSFSVIVVIHLFPEPFHFGATLLIGTIFGAWISIFVAREVPQRILAFVLTTFSYPLAFWSGFIMLSPLSIGALVLGFGLIVMAIVVIVRWLRKTYRFWGWYVGIVPLVMIGVIIGTNFFDPLASIMMSMFFAFLGSLGTAFILIPFVRLLGRSDTLLVLSFAILSSVVGVGSSPSIGFMGPSSYGSMILYMVFPIVVGWVLFARVAAARTIPQG